MCMFVCVCVLACNGCGAAVSLWAVYGLYALPSSCSSVSHVIIQTAVIGWERSRRGGRAEIDVHREGSAIGGSKERRGWGEKGCLL